MKFRATVSLLVVFVGIVLVAFWSRTGPSVTEYEESADVEVLGIRQTLPEDARAIQVIDRSQCYAATYQISAASLGAWHETLCESYLEKHPEWPMDFSTLQRSVLASGDREFGDAFNPIDGPVDGRLTRYDFASTPGGLSMVVWHNEKTGIAYQFVSFY